MKYLCTKVKFNHKYRNQIEQTVSKLLKCNCQCENGLNNKNVGHTN